MDYINSERENKILEKHKNMLSKLAQVSNSGITLFDMHIHQHVFTSYNFSELLGYDVNMIELSGNEYFDSHIHPDDLKVLEDRGIAVYKIIDQKIVNINECKFVNEYRVRNKMGEYVRIIEQHQIIEHDDNDNLWLSLSVIDISPDQSDFEGVKSQIINYRTGEFLSVEKLVEGKSGNPLSPREVEILKMVSDGLPSKEIAEQLFISIHTVNTHRQRILEKLNVSNSLEAVKYASQLGLFED